MSTDQPAIEQAEAYLGEDCVAIRSAKTTRIIDRMQAALGDRFVVAADFAEFLLILADRVRGGTAVIALGDSTTANYTGWPRSLSLIPRLRERGTVVINLADWGLTTADQPQRLAFALDWLGYHRVVGRTAIYLGGLLDWQYRRRAYDHAAGAGIASAILASEAALASRDDARELRPLLVMATPEGDRLDQWIALRTVAVAHLLQRLCKKKDTRFVAALQPLCFADTAPAYAAALRANYDSEPPGKLDFAAWCRERGYYRDLADRYGEAARAGLDVMAKAWPDTHSGPSGAWLNLADLFRDAQESGFLPSFDAVHFSQAGAGRIAAALAAALD